MTSYRIEFIPAALREWKKLDNTTRIQFEKKLKQVADNPHILSAKMHGHPNAYRLKARSKGYRLTVFVVAIGKRERGEVFELGLRRLRERDD
jgi:mRNA interferase RelE/StbE